MLKSIPGLRRWLTLTLRLNIPVVWRGSPFFLWKGASEIESSDGTAGGTIDFTRIIHGAAVMFAASEPNSLLSAAVGGDTAALMTLLSIHHDEVRAFVARRIPTAMQAAIDADNLMQETHVAAFRRIQQFQVTDERAFGRWLRAIGIYRLRKALRGLRAVKRGEGRPPLSINPQGSDSVAVILDLFVGSARTPSVSLARLEAIDALIAAIEKLPADYRDAVRLVNLEGLPVVEAATRMGRTERAVHNLCYKAREMLRNLLASRA